MSPNNNAASSNVDRLNVRGEVARPSADRLSEEKKNVPLSAPLRNLGLTLALTIASLAAAGAVWGVAGYEMLIVAMGWPHVVLGFLFYFGRVLRGEPKGVRASFALLAALTVFFWTLHHLFALTALIYVYFLYHAFRDEIAIYMTTRAAHRPRASVYATAGVAPLILLMLFIPQPPAFRQDARRVEFTGAAVARPPAAGATNWTLLSFEPIADSRGRDFYFTLQAPRTKNLRAFTTLATTAPDGAGGGGVVRVNDERWGGASELLFEPHYAPERAAENGAEENRTPPPRGDAASGAATAAVPVLLTGGHSVGQTFRAERDRLAGLWIPIDRFEDEGEATEFLFRLASPPLLPLSPAAVKLRWAALAAFGLWMLWSLLPRLAEQRELWIYLGVFVGLFAILQYALKLSARGGHVAPMIFQFVVVFHYWSWYVFSFDKLRRAPADAAAVGATPAPESISFYDRLLRSLRRRKTFLATVLALNAASAAASYFYYQAPNAPDSLRFLLDYHYFLYFLVLHVTFSFAPPSGREAWAKMRRWRATEA